MIPMTDKNGALGHALTIIIGSANMSALLVFNGTNFFRAVSAIGSQTEMEIGCHHSLF
jgi:hypothetical protein